MPAILDWTVDKLLGQVDVINHQAEQERARVNALRVRYNSELRALSSITDPALKTSQKAALSGFIPGLLDAEKRVREFDEKWAAFKSAVRNFLGGAHIPVPSYLNFAPIVIPPAAIVTALLIAGGLIVVLSGLTNNLDKKMQAIEYARRNGVDPNDLLDSDFVKALKAAAPLLGMVAAVVLLPQVLRALPARRGGAS